MTYLNGISLTHHGALCVYKTPVISKEKRNMGGGVLFVWSWSWTIYEIILSFSLIGIEVTVVLLRDERLILSIETLIQKELCLRPRRVLQTQRFSSGLAEERVYRFSWRGKMWGSNINQYRDSKCSKIREATLQSNYSKSSVLETLCKTVRLNV